MEKNKFIPTKHLTIFWRHFVLVDIRVRHGYAECPILARVPETASIDFVTVHSSPIVYLTLACLAVVLKGEQQNDKRVLLNLYQSI